MIWCLQCYNSAAKDLPKSIGATDAPDLPLARAAAGSGTRQCHGKAGDHGPCSRTVEDVSISMQCQSETLPNGNERNFCAASVACPGGEILSCSGRDREIFAGRKMIDGKERGFLHCKGGPENTYSDHCS